MSDGKDPTRKRTGRNGDLADWANLNTQERHAPMAAGSGESSGKQ
jgi:hypothetical protein